MKFELSVSLGLLDICEITSRLLTGLYRSSDYNRVLDKWLNNPLTSTDGLEYELVCYLKAYGHKGFVPNCRTNQLSVEEARKLKFIVFYKYAGAGEPLTIPNISSMLESFLDPHRECPEWNVYNFLLDQVTHIPDSHIYKGSLLDRLRDLEWRIKKNEDALIDSWS